MNNNDIGCLPLGVFAIIPILCFVLFIGVAIGRSQACFAVCGNQYWIWEDHCVCLEKTAIPVGPLK